jgi:hypothetical protein
VADLGQDADSLHIKALEKEVQIEEKLFAKKRIDLEILKLHARERDLERSKIQIDEQVASHRLDLVSLRAAATAAGAEHNV